MPPAEFILGLAAALAPVSPLARLPAPGPLPAYQKPLMDFGRLVGHWRMKIETYGDDGATLQKIRGTWDFGWILEGRAIQDVFITFPSHPPRGSHLQPSIGEYGTTVRMYDPTTDRWAITYVGPRHHMSIAFTASRIDDSMVLERREADGELTHWVFDEIGVRHFRWRALSSKDHGATWHLDELMVGSRA